MAVSFLGTVVEQLKSQQPNWADLCFVLPTRRARLFLQKELINALEGPLILPEMVSIDDFVSSVSTLMPASELMQQHMLYQSYCATGKASPLDSFEIFLGWASSLLKDLNTMDQYLIERESFFSYLSSLHKLRSWGQYPDKIIQNYTAFWQYLPHMYSDFSQRLEEKGHATPGMCYRLATELLESFLQHKTKTQFIFCGFNALSPSEEYIVQELLFQERAQIFWDIDAQMLASEHHQSAVFIRRYAQQWPQYKNRPFPQAHQVFQEPKSIHVIEVQQQVGQVKQLSALLTSLTHPDDWSKTAVVLADETLLLPLLYALPSSIEKLNISMGFPLEHHPLSLFISTFLEMAMRQTSKGFYYKDIASMLSLPEMQALFAEDPTFCTAVLSKAKKENRNYITPEFLERCAHEISQELITQLFQTNTSASQWIDTVLTILPRFYASQETQPLTEVYRIAVEKLLSLFTEIKGIIAALGLDPSYSLLRTLYNQLSAGQKLHFVGAPLEGLQILGVLETRTIDFDRVLMAGVNEGILPTSSGQSSWIPYDVKKEFGLPTQDEQDAIFTYHFYRLMYRAKDIFLLYNGTTDGMQVGERSRFIRQWAFEKPATHLWEERIQEATFIPPKRAIPLVPKTDDVLHKLKALASEGLSPSALNMFVKNPYMFYTQYVLGLKEEEELETSFSHKTYGTLIHNSLEELYTPFVGKILTVANCTQMIESIDAVTTRHASRIYPHQISGKNILALAAIKRNIHNIIVSEQKEIEEGNTIEILGLETKLRTTRSYKGILFPIHMKGTIDRVDRYNNDLRVLDYKTGQVASGKLGIYDWSLVDSVPEYGQAVQLLMYAMMWNDTHPDQKVNRAGIIALKDHLNGVHYVGEKASPLARSKETELSKSRLQHAEEMVERIVKRLMDKEIPFTDPEN